jgi:hypothetical protein
MSSHSLCLALNVTDNDPGKFMIPEYLNDINRRLTTRSSFMAFSPTTVQVVVLHPGILLDAQLDWLDIHESSPERFLDKLHC